MINLGNVPVNQDIHFLFSTNNGDGGAVAPTVAGTVSVYKDDGTTQYTSDITYTPSFDGVTGVNLVKIETTNAFYVAGHDYTVVLSGATIDGETVNAILAYFSIEARVANVNLAI